MTEIIISFGDFQLAYTITMGGLDANSNMKQNKPSVCFANNHHMNILVSESYPNCNETRIGPKNIAQEMTNNEGLRY